jgi:hypothetical protein
MKTARTALSALLLAGALSVTAAAQPPAPALLQPALNAAVAVGVGIQGPTVGVDYFYSNLAPYGYWVNRPSFGWAWVPRQVRHGWRPYTYGRWAYTDYGWTWVSAEPFGWATYHYGRWNLDPDYGWEWVPGTDWGPAWVSWQEGDGYLGWAPLPPQVGFSAGVGLDLGGFNLNVGIDPGWYCFAPERSFLAVNVGAFIVPSFRNAAIFRNTTNITNYRFAGGRVFNNAVAVDRIARVTGQPVRQLRFAAAGAPGRARVNGDSVAMFRPAAVVRRANTPDPSRVAPRSVATGRVAQQLVQERHGMAAQLRQPGTRQGAAARTAQATTAHRSNAVAQSRQTQARHQAIPAGRRQGTAQAQVAHGQPGPQVRHHPSATAPHSQGTAHARRQVTPANRGHQPPPQATSGRSHQASRPTPQASRPTPQASRRTPQASRRTPQAPRRTPQASRPTPQASRRTPQAPDRRQPAAPARRQSPPPERQAQAEVRRPSPPPQRQPQPEAQVRGHASPPPQRQAPPQHQQPPPRAERQAPPPQQHQAEAQHPAPQRQAHAQPPPQARRERPGEGGVGSGR